MVHRRILGGWIADSHCRTGSTNPADQPTAEEQIRYRYLASERNCRLVRSAGSTGAGLCGHERDSLAFSVVPWARASRLASVGIPFRTTGTGTLDSHPRTCPSETSRPLDGMDRTPCLDRLVVESRTLVRPSATAGLGGNGLRCLGRGIIAGSTPHVCRISCRVQLSQPDFAPGFWCGWSQHRFPPHI